MAPLQYSDIVASLFLAVPEAKTAYDKWEMPGDSLAYIVFSFLDQAFFTPTVNSENDQELLGRIFQFFERMATSNDAEVVNLLYVGVFEAWIGDKTTLRRAFKHMKPATKTLATEAAHHLQCGQNLPS